MSELQEVDVTNYLFQKLCYCPIFKEDFESELDQFLWYLEQPIFWKIFERELSFLLSRHCLLQPEIDRIYRFLSIMRNTKLDSNSWNIINKCISKLNTYKVDMDIQYYDGFYVFEMKKRFPNVKWEEVENYVSVVQASVAMDFHVLWSLVIDDEKYFQEDLLPVFKLIDFYLSNIRAFAYEMPELLRTDVVYHRLELLIEKYKQDIKDYRFIDKIKAKRLIAQYEQFLAE